jgi:hypothetical protein
MGTRDTYETTLSRACLAVGDEQVLARRLGVPLDTVVNWLLGDAPVPTAVFLTCVDIIIASNKIRIADTRAYLQQVRERHRR